MAVMEGFDDLNRKLLALGDPKKIKGIARNAIRAGQRVVVKAIKAKIPGRYKEARKTVGSSFKRAKFGEDKGQIVAKIGMAVGKKRMSDSEANSNYLKRGKRKGVGLGVRNIHWAVLGTGQRATKEPERRTGKMPAILAGVVQAGFASSQAEAAAKINATIASGLAKLAK